MTLTQNRVGTLSQQLAAVDQYLSLPQSVRRDIGDDIAWARVMRGVLEGRTATVPDNPLREAVIVMRQLQRRLYAKQFEPEGRLKLLERLREHEKLVDRYLAQP